MKTFYTVCALLLTTVMFGQKKETYLKKNKVKVESLSMIADSAEELKKIDWEEMVSVFSENDDNDSISMTFGINHKKSKYKLKSSITISGKKENMEEHIEKAKKAVETIIKIANKKQ